MSIEKTTELGNNLTLMGQPFQNLQSFHSQVVGSSSSLSPPSEPPDIRNWFSSYVYESPILDSTHNKGDVDSKTSTSAKGSFFVGRGRKGEAKFVTSGRVNDKEVNPNGLDLSFEDEDHENQHSSKSLGTFCSLSSLSEPPDIRKWFASYVYDSSLSENEEGFLTGNISVDNEDMGLNSPSDVYATNDDSFEENSWAKQSISKIVDSAGMTTNSSPSSASHSVKVLDPCLKDERLLNHDNGVTKDALRFENSSSGCELPAEAFPVNEIADGIYSQLGTNTENEEDRIAGGSLWRRGQECLAKAGNDNEKENAKENENSGKGFVSTRNRPHQMSMQCLGNNGRVSCEKNMAVKRKALAETTNISQIGAVEVTGKWQCPQKSKPFLGPPLKQLRLEQWIHRM